MEFFWFSFYFWLKGTPSEDASWPDDAENGRMFPLASLYASSVHICAIESLFFLLFFFCCFIFEFPWTQPRSFNLYQSLHCFYQCVCVCVQFCLYLCNKKLFFFFFASYLSSSGHSHVRSLFTDLYIVFTNVCVCIVLFIFVQQKAFFVCLFCFIFEHPWTQPCCFSLDQSARDAGLALDVTDCRTQNSSLVHTCIQQNPTIIS